MLCQNCQKNTATAFFKQTINGKTATMHLCSECAAQMGSSALNNDFSLGGFFSNFFDTSNASSVTTARVCPNCGTTLAQITSSGFFGCGECIKNFYDQVVPMISRIHGNAEHTGKIPKSAGPKIRLKSRIGELKGKLDTAIAAQEFEEAAKLRDEIRSLEEQVDNGE